MKSTSQWNTTVYGLWAPFYDMLFTLPMASARRRVVELLDPQPGERILLAGVGTGADLSLLPGGVQAIGLDFSPNMLAQAKIKLSGLAAQTHLAQADAQLMPLPANCFDAAILSLVLSVVPNGQVCFAETVRVVRPGGRIVVFDKFLPEGQPAKLPRRALNNITMLAGTDINRRFSDVVAGEPYTLLHQEASILAGAYQIMLLELPV